MKKSVNVKLFVSAAFIVSFAVWTVIVKLVDVKGIGPCGSSVGLAVFNRSVHDLFGVNMSLYTLTDFLSIIPIGIAAGFAVLGLVQLIRRKSFLRVDRSILVLGVFYIIVMAVYLLFETVVVNYRPVLIEGVLEASYPSSTTMLVTCIMPMAMMQFNSRIKRKGVRLAVNICIVTFTLFMVIARLVSGVHWVTDIIGGSLISAGLVLLYAWAVEFFSERR